MLRPAPVILGVLCSGIFCFCSLALRAQEQNTSLQELLDRPILAPQKALADAQRFVGARVPEIPHVDNLPDWERRATEMRQDTLERVVYRGQAAQWRDAQTQVEWLDSIPGGPGYSIKKLRYEALPGLWIPALLYVPDRLDKRVPVAMNVNGHDPNGKAADYKQVRCINEVKRGMLVLNVEWLGMGQLTALTHPRMNQLDLCGTSGLAPFYLAMKRGLDLLLAHEHADPSRVVVAGLSGGGWQTILISALDTRVTLANPVAGYSSLKTRIEHPSDWGDSEQMPVDLATVADYAHLTALRAPRPTLLTYNSKDECCFKSGHALPPLLDAAKPIFALYDSERNLRSHVNDDPGTHNFLKENREALYRMIADHFYPDDPHFVRTEIPSDAEVKSKEELLVAMPERNATFQSLALELCATLPREPDLPTDRAAATLWHSAQRERLRQITRAKVYLVREEKQAESQSPNLRAVSWRLKLFPEGQSVPNVADWTVPMWEFSRGTPQKTAVLIADKGRSSVAAHVERLLDSGYRVLAVDPLNFGESKFTPKNDVFALFFSSVGERLLGIQAGQFGAIARWAQTEFGTRDVSVVTIGPRTGMIGLVAAGLDEHSIPRLESHAALGSLKELIEQNRAVEEMPELFCFGLLEAFDVRHLAALVFPRAIEFHESAERLRTELKPLNAYSDLLGGKFGSPE